jgi:Flp pilus assembly pilin Flp
MTRIEQLKKLLKDTRGETGFIEWMILVAVIALFCLAAFQGIGQAIQGQANTKAGQIQGLP